MFIAVKAGGVMKFQLFAFKLFNQICVNCKMSKLEYHNVCAIKKYFVANKQLMTLARISLDINISYPLYSERSQVWERSETPTADLIR